jgi:hypothetical protein
MPTVYFCLSCRTSSPLVLLTSPTSPSSDPLIVLLSVSWHGPLADLVFGSRFWSRWSVLPESIWFLPRASARQQRCHPSLVSAATGDFCFDFYCSGHGGGQGPMPEVGDGQGDSSREPLHHPIHISLARIMFSNPW